MLTRMVPHILIASFIFFFFIVWLYVWLRFILSSFLFFWKYRSRRFTVVYSFDSLLVKLLISHSEISHFQLLYSCLKSSILLPLLYQLVIYSIDWCCCRQYFFSEASVHRITFLHYLFDLAWNKTLIVFFIIWKYSFDQLKSFSERLVFKMHLKQLSIFTLDCSVLFLHLVS